MRSVIWLGLAASLFAVAGGSVIEPRQPAPVAEAPAPIQHETFAGQTPREYSPGYKKAQEADRAFEVLDVAFERVWEIPDPRAALVQIVLAAAQVDPVRACDRIRAASVRLQKLKLSPAREVTWDWLAVAAAPQDRELRDALLRLAVAHAARSLADANLWKPDPVPPGTVPMGDPRQLREFERQMLEYSVRLWQAILVKGTDPGKGIELTKALLADAKQKGVIPLGCISRSYDYTLAEDLSGLDADLFLAVMSEVWPKKLLAQVCASRAYSRWLDYQRDSFTGVLARYAIENGAANGDVMRIHNRFEFQKALEQSRKGMLVLPIDELAWHDPDAALAIAEKEPDETQRRGMIDAVAQVWAYKRPEQIERAIKNQDNEVRRSWARNMAREELEWRKKGNPPRDTPETKPDPFRPQPKKLAGTPWVPPPDLQKLLDDPAREADADRWIHKQAPHMGQWGPADHAVEMIKRIKSPHLLANSATWAARGLIRREERD
jgi:hypothetical protein